jgi:antitoxin component YwqK of YwqJK toxin-antitoxin module
VQNQFDGPFKKYTEDGKIKEEKIYKNGKVINQ